MDLSVLAAAFEAEATALIRTDFTDDAAWARVVAAVSRGVDFDTDELDDEDGYAPHLEVVDNPAMAAATAESLAAAWDRDLPGGYVLLADTRSMAEAGQDRRATLVYVDLMAEDDDELGEIYGSSFRCPIAEVASIEANLAISNMEFCTFADAAAERGDGVFLGLS